MKRDTTSMSTKTATKKPINPRLIQPQKPVVPIPGYPAYFACSDGNIYSKALKFGKTPDNYMRLTPFINQGGQYVVSLKRDDGCFQKVRVARLMALAFLGQPPYEGASAKLIIPELPPAYNNVVWAKGGF